MTFQVKDRWNIPVTAVADEFIDQYMAAANGEYVKVYLYLLRHQSEPVSVDAIADALNHTESDVRRALAYWEKAGVLLREDLLSPDGREKAVGTATDRPEAGAVLDREMSGGRTGITGRQQEGFDGGQAGRNGRGAAYRGENQAGADGRSAVYDGGLQAGADGRGAAYGADPQAGADGRGAAYGVGQQAGVDGRSTAYHEVPKAGTDGRGAAFSVDPQTSPDTRSTAYHGSTPIGADGWSASYSGVPQAGNQTVPAAVQPQGAVSESAPTAGRTESVSFGTAPAAAAPSPKPVYSVAQVNRLSGDEEFAQILYIAQKYMNKVFTPRDCQVFAYLYDTLKFSPELLEYLVEYCVQNGHVSVRYMETVAINWHEQGFRTPDEAKEYVEGFNNDAFSVMKAFGLNDRRPATEEQKMITKWFREYGFGRELVLMACNRTISAIHTPSFRYADKILSDWKLAGVRTKADVEALDEKRSKSRAQGAGGQTQGGRSTGGQGAGQADGGRRKSNQFHNFKQRDTDYDALVLKQLKERVNQQ
ncbi:MULTISPECIES: DnaD domain protein [Enterocloster]|uniref:DnaD and phage-associated domain-containing protein n=1 Tax=Enterocloster lavalensis TaxID=460384 RepID=A0A1I0IBU5_9FIRM|nr:DnaD domain protein [Enterocloster lavalensis]MDR3758213.1 DnaD domain protein [Enterocloster sp.]SET93546.1 DnaD and phage-associated domain-containing protein [Enterocloster lavalensis]